jgi:hypothetical protein
MFKGSKTHSKRKRGLEGALEREVGLGNTLPWMVKGSKAHSKGDEGSKTHLKGNEGSKALLKRKVGLGNTLTWMIKGSKVHFKGDEGSKALSKREVGLGNALPREWKMKGGGKIQRFFRWPNSHGRPAQQFHLGHFKVAFHLITKAKFTL